MRSITELKSLNYTSIGLIEDFISLRYDLKGFYFFRKLFTESGIWKLYEKFSSLYSIEDIHTSIA